MSEKFTATEYDCDTLKEEIKTYKIKSEKLSRELEGTKNNLLAVSVKLKDSIDKNEKLRNELNATKKALSIRDSE
jgi:chromosome segregation ATPase